MNTKHYWWNDFGPFHPKDSRGQYPNPGEVVLHYRLLRKMTGRGLADQLGISPSMTCYMEKDCIGLDSVFRCRELASLLQIPAFLFGLDSLYHALDGYSPWWEKEGYPPFDTGDDGYPLIGQVIKHYRERKLRQLPQLRSPESGKESWTQSGLATALNISEFTVRKMENNHKGLDSITRRQALAFLLNIPPILLGLDPLVHRSNVELELSQALHLSKPRIITLSADTLTKYRKFQEDLWIEYFTYDGQEAIRKALSMTRQIEEIISLIRGEQQSKLIEIQSVYYQFIEAVALERRDYQRVFAYANQAVAYAEDTGNEELVASALLRRAMAQYGNHNLDAAISDIDRAVIYAQEASAHIKGTVLQNAGMLHAHKIQTNIDIAATFRLLDQAGHIARSNDLAEDDYFLRFNLGMYHIRRAIALIAIGRSEESSRKRGFFKEALEQLDLAEKQTNTSMTRRRALINLFRAQAHCGLGEFYCATKEALEALEVFVQIRSYINIGYISEVYRLLCASSYRDAPLVLRLGWELKQSGELP